MCNNPSAAIGRSMLFAAPLGLALFLAACGDGDGNNMGGGAVAGVFGKQ